MIQLLRRTVGFPEYFPRLEFIQFHTAAMILLTGPPHSSQHHLDATLALAGGLRRSTLAVT